MPPISLDQEYIEKLIKISKNAGDAIMDIYESEFDVNFKSDQSPLTKADVLSNKIICQSLKKITPDIPILSEECCDIPFEERSSWKTYWLVDPLDGTKEFINKNGEFTVNIALIRDNKPIFGVINIPTINKTFWGAETLGSYEINKNKDVKKISNVKKINKKIRILTSRSHIEAEMDIIKGIEDYELLPTGSSLKFCLIANGQADAYIRLGPTSEWDVAAGHAIIEYSGCIITDLKGKKIKYNQGESFIMKGFMVSKNKQISNIFSSLLMN